MTTTGKWKLNGVELGSADVRIFAVSSSLNLDVRQAVTDLHGRTQHRERLGKGLAKKRIEFRFHGREAAKWTEMSNIMDVLEDDNVWTLEAPSHESLKVYKTYTRAAFGTDSISQDDQRATGSIALTVEAIVDGVWIADGGNFCETISGHFTRLATGHETLTIVDNTSSFAGTTATLEGEGAQTYASQSFTPLSNGTLAPTVQVKLFNSTANAGLGEIRISDSQTSGGVTATIDYSDIDSGDAEVMSYTLGSYDLVAGQTYYLTVKAITPGAFITVMLVDPGDYSGGAASLQGGADLNMDMSFKVQIVPTAYEREDGVATSGPLVRLPQQSDGYPKAIRASDFAEVEVPGPAATVQVSIGGNTVYMEDYDMTEFLTPAITATGGVGVYQICSSPSRSYLGGGIDDAPAGGIGEGAIGEFSIGES